MVLEELLDIKKKFNLKPQFNLTTQEVVDAYLLQVDTTPMFVFQSKQTDKILLTKVNIYFMNKLNLRYNKK